MNKVYLISDGSYSDYRIVAVCSTKELAEEAKLCYATTNAIEEMELDKIPPRYEGMLGWFVRFRANGDINYVCQASLEHFKERITEFEDVDYSSSRSLGKGLHVHLYAKDKDHATKSACDRRRQYLATK